MNSFSETNPGYGMLDEYVGLQRQVDRIDGEIDANRSKIAADERRVEALVARQEELAARLGPALRKSGPVLWTESHGEKYMIADNTNESLLDVVKLDSPFAVKLDPPPAFSRAEISEAAAHAAAEDFVMDDDDDAPTLGDVISLPGRQATIANGVAVIDQEVG